MPLSIRPIHRVPVQGLTSIQRMKLVAIVSSICLALTSLMVNAAEPLNSSPLDRKSFKTIPFDPAPSDTQQRELERAGALCVKTVDSEVLGSHFEAHVDGNIVSTIGTERDRFKFWKCMSQDGHPLAPISK